MIQCLKNPIRLGCLATVFFSLATSAQAQYFVPYGAGYGYDSGGAWGSFAAAVNSASQQRAYSNYRDQAGASVQSYSQSWRDINNQVASQRGGQGGVADDAQAARNWMAQNQRPMPMPPSRSGGSDEDLRLPTIQVPKPQEKEIMMWPTLLKTAVFASDRTQIEAPFRRAYSTKQPMTADDYRSVLEAVDRMENQVQSMKSSLIESEFKSVESYIADLRNDAQKRLDAKLK